MLAGWIDWLLPGVRAAALLTQGRGWAAGALFLLLLVAVWLCLRRGRR